MVQKYTRIFSLKSQVSLYMILGIVLLIGIVGFFMFRSTGNFEEDRAITISDYAEVAVVQQFVTSCLEEISEDALLLAGQQGGYTDLTTVGAYASYFDATEADAFTFTQNSQIQIPYWHYLLSDNECSGDCIFFSQRPRLEGNNARTVEQQVKTYFNRNFAACLGNFASFINQGYEITEGYADDRRLDPIDGREYPFELEVLFRENDVKITLDYPLTISQGETTDQVSSYSVEHNIPFKRMYTLASALTAVELEYRYLETQTIELISLNSGIDASKLPPLGGSTNEFTSTIFWLVPDVQAKLQELLAVYTNALRVKGTQNYREITFPQSAAKPALDRAFANMVIPLSDEELFNDIAVNYEYLNWPWYFNINSNGQIIEPDSLSIDFFPFFGIQRYRHYYDVSNPVRVALTHEGARDGEGFTFAFGLENNVRNNVPMRENYADFNLSDRAKFEPVDEQNTLVCNIDQRNTDDVAVTVVDKYTNERISDAAVIFTCGDESCTLGKTNAAGEYVGQLPICGGATLSAIKEQTVSGATSLSTSLDFDQPQKIELVKIVEKNITAKKHLIVKSVLRKFAPWEYARLTDLDVKERVIISANRVSSNPNDQAHSAATVIEGSAGPDEVFTMRLVPGYYEVTIQSIIDERLYIPESVRFAEDEVYTIDAVDMKQFPAGNLKLDETLMLWYISPNDLYDEETSIEFYYAASDLPNVDEEYRVVEDLQKPRKIIDTLLAKNTTIFIPNIIK